MAYPKFFRLAAQEVKNNPNIKNPLLWAIWLIPMAVIPTTRYFSDKSRSKDDRLGLSLEMFSQYAMGTALYFLLNPLAGLATKRLFPMKPESFHTLACGMTGSLASALYSGLFANKLAAGMQKLLKRDAASKPGDTDTKPEQKPSGTSPDVKQPQPATTVGGNKRPDTPAQFGTLRAPSSPYVARPYQNSLSLR